MQGRVRETEARCLTLISPDKDLGVSKIKSPESPMERGTTPSDHRSGTCVLGADSLHHEAGRQGVERGDADKGGETARRKRALHTLLNAHSSSSKSRFTSEFGSVGGGRDPLDGYPSKSVILAMHRRGLELLAAKFPSVLPHRHAHIHRYFPLAPMQLISVDASATLELCAILVYGMCAIIVYRVSCVMGLTSWLRKQHLDRCAPSRGSWTAAGQNSKNFGASPHLDNAPRRISEWCARTERYVSKYAMAHRPVEKRTGKTGAIRARRT